ncbi:MAG: OmpA family protein [Bryobacteraceae bacterium]
MARRHKHAAHENLERWLVSYADFITLMFAFFVVMFASSQTDRARAQQVSDSVRRALEEGQIASMIAGILGGTVGDKGKGNAMLKGPGGTKTEPTSREKNQFWADLLPSLQLLSDELKTEIASGKLSVKLEPRGLVVSLTEAAFFPTGEDTIDPATYPSIEKIAAAIQKLPNPVRLEGHTDSVPIHNARFRSNWELSAARAIAMLNLLTTRFGVDPKRLAVVGYADTMPVDTNETEDGRRHNRRVDIVILNRLGFEVEPLPPEGKPPATSAADRAH